MAWTLNPSDKSANLTLSNGNLTASCVEGIGDWKGARCIEPLASGKWYFEFVFGSVGSHMALGIATASADVLDNPVGNVADSYGRNIYGQPAGSKFSCAVDTDAKKLWVWQDGVLGTRDPENGTNPDASAWATDTYYPAITEYAQSDGATINFGKTAFQYTPPLGFSGMDVPVVVEATQAESATASVTMTPGGLSKAISQSVTVADTMTTDLLSLAISESAEVAGVMVGVRAVGSISEQALINVFFSATKEQVITARMRATRSAATGTGKTGINCSMKATAMFPTILGLVGAVAQGNSPVASIFAGGSIVNVVQGSAVAPSRVGKATAWNVVGATAILVAPFPTIRAVGYVVSVVDHSAVATSRRGNSSARQSSDIIDGVLWFGKMGVVGYARNVAPLRTAKGTAS